MENKETNKKSIPGYEGLYSVTEDGYVISEQRFTSRMEGDKLIKQPVKERILKPHTAKAGGYQVVNLCKDGNCLIHYTHRLVAEAFLPPPRLGQTQVRHKEGNPLLNSKNDLEWGTPTENSLDRLKHGTMKNGESNGMAKLTIEQVLKMRAEVAGGRERRCVAAENSIPMSTFNAIVRRDRWKHV